MNDQYKFEELENLIKKVAKKKKKSNLTMQNYLHLQSLFVYLGYSLANIHIQEEELQKMKKNNNDKFMNNSEYADCLYKIYSSGITVYSYIRVCLHISKTIIENLPKNSELQKFRKNQTWKKWAENLINKRNLVSAHPNNKTEIIWKPSGYKDDGTIYFRAINLFKPMDSKKITLEPKKEYNHLCNYLSELTIILDKT